MERGLERKGVASFVAVFGLVVVCGTATGEELERAADVEAEAEAAEIVGFRDCDHCPEMVRLPAGTFRMGYGRPRGEPIHHVSVPAFALSRTEVTFEQWSACSDAGVCRDLSEALAGDPKLPVRYVTWHDAREYADWLSRETGERYRLPTEAEWEYAARAGRETAYGFGNVIDVERVRFCPPSEGRTSSACRTIVPVGSLPPNAWGLYEMHGNVAEWVEDDAHDSYHGAPTDGSAFIDSPRAEKRVVRGGGVPSAFYETTSSFRDDHWPARGIWYLGLRLARDVPGAPRESRPPVARDVDRALPQTVDLDNPDAPVLRSLPDGIVTAIEQGWGVAARTNPPAPRSGSASAGFDSLEERCVSGVATEANERRLCLELARVVAIRLERRQDFAALSRILGGVCRPADDVESAYVAEGCLRLSVTYRLSGDLEAARATFARACGIEPEDDRCERSFWEVAPSVLEARPGAFGPLYTAWYTASRRIVETTSCDGCFATSRPVGISPSLAYSTASGRIWGSCAREVPTAEDADACLHLVRLALIDRKPSASEEAARVLRTVCGLSRTVESTRLAGVSAVSRACSHLSALAAIDGDAESAVGWLERACGLAPELCNVDVLEWLSGGFDMEVLVPERAAGVGRACEVGVAHACRELLRYGSSAQSQRAVERGCEIGDGVACFRSGSPARLTQWLEPDCDAGHADACIGLAWIRVLGQGGTPDLVSAAAALDRGCNADGPRWSVSDACRVAGRFGLAGLGPSLDSSEIAAYFERFLEVREAPQGSDISWLDKGKEPVVDALAHLQRAAKASVGTPAPGGMGRVLSVLPSLCDRGIEGACAAVRRRTAPRRVR